MNFFTALCAIFLAIVLFLNAPRVLKEYHLSKSDNFVTVTVKKLPDCSAGYKNKFIHITYNSKTHILRTSCKYVTGLSNGQQVDMLHEPNTEIFLFKEEDVTFELVSFAIIALVLIACLINSLRPTRPKRKVRTTPASQNGS